jgi:hypothetical protein
MEDDEPTQEPTLEVAKKETRNEILARARAKALEVRKKKAAEKKEFADMAKEAEVLEKYNKKEELQNKIKSLTKKEPEPPVEEPIKNEIVEEEKPKKKTTKKVTKVESESEEEPEVEVVKKPKKKPKKKVVLLENSSDSEEGEQLIVQRVRKRDLMKKNNLKHHINHHNLK